MNPIVVILVAGFEVPAQVCTLPNPVGEICGARISDIEQHIKWHMVRENGPKVIRWCQAGQHEYLKSAVAPSTLNCSKCVDHQGPRGPEKRKRMLSTGVEKTESIKAA